MRQLRPTPGETLDVADAADGVRPAPGGRPWVAVNMICSADGAAARDGLSGGLGSAADHALFRALRARADAIVVGAQTVRSEGYGPARPAPQARAARMGRGQSPAAPIAVVSSALDLDVDSPFFTEPAERPMVITHRASDPDRRAILRERADVLLCGERTIDLCAAMAELALRGHRFVLAEGGPRLNGALLDADLVDELNLTIAPVALGGPAPRIARGDREKRGLPLRLERVLEADGNLLLRYLRASEYHEPNVCGTTRGRPSGGR